MSFLERIKKAFTGGQDEPEFSIVSKSVGWNWFETRDKLADLAGNAYAGLTPKMNTQKAFRYYRSWVYNCVNLIQRKIIETPFYIYKEIGQPNDEEYDRILDHPVVRLLKRPNKFMSGRQLRQVIQVNLDLVGMAFLLILYNDLGTPGELHHLSPTWLTNIMRGETTNDLIRGFSFAPPYQRGMAREYSYAEIVYFHYPDPEDPVLPLPPLQPISHVLDIDLLLQIYEKDFFNNNARPDGLLATDQSITEDEANRLQERWNARYRGPTKQHKIAILTDGLTYQPIGMSAKDFEFAALSEYVKDQILAAYGIPEAELGLFESFNKASSITSETKFVKGCIEPRLRLWEDVINSQLMPCFVNSEQLEFKFESALPKDDEWKLMETQGNLSMGLVSVNEERRKRGFKPWDSALFDVPWTVTGEPLRGANAEADKLWDEKTEKMMGGGMPGMAGGAAAGGGAGGEAGLPALPTAQGAMGQLGGRPEGQALSTLMTAASRRTNAPLSTLLNAARGRRGGLAALMANHPNEMQLMSMLDKNRTDQALSRLLGMASKGYEPDTPEEEIEIREILKAYIESQLDDVDKFMFRPYEDMLSELEPLEAEYMEVSRDMYLGKGEELAATTYKMIQDFQTKGSMDENDIETWRDNYVKASEEYITKAVEIGVRFGVGLVEKATSTKYDKHPEYYAMEAAGKLLDRSADLKASTTKNMITGVISDGVEQGLSTNEVAENIKSKFKQISGPRAMLIARTEMSAALNAGLDAGFKKVNSDAGTLVIKEAHVWTALDERVCKECKPLHDEIAISYVKNKEYQEMPIHPNCRCVLRPILV